MGFTMTDLKWCIRCEKRPIRGYNRSGRCYHCRTMIWDKISKKEAVIKRGQARMKKWKAELAKLKREAAK